MKAAAKYKVWLKITGEVDEEAGEITLYSDDYGKLKEADAVAALRAEVKTDASGMLSWRHVFVPREIFRGFRVQMVSTWLDTPEIITP